MEVNEIVKEVGNLLQLTTVQSFDFDTDDLAEASDLVQRDINLIVTCLNQTLNKIATEYIELVASENITVSGGEFDLSGLTNQVYKVKNLGTAKFAVQGQKLLAQNGDYKVVYSYLPEALEVDGDLEIYQNLPKYAIIYGICSEFCLILGDFAQSETWESKFENSLESARENLRVATIKARRWK